MCIVCHVLLAVAQLDAVCHLAVMFLTNVSVSGYSVTDSVHSKVDAHLTLTCKHVLTLLHHNCTKPVRSHTMFINFCSVFSTLIL